MKALLIVILSGLLISSLSSCSATWHLKQSEKHYKKAIMKGYKPVNDNETVNRELPALNINFSDSKRIKYIKGLTKLIAKKNPLEPTILSERNQYKNRTEILHYKIDSILQTIPKALTLDTVRNYGDSIKVHTWLENGKLKQTIEVDFPQRKIYINPLDNFLQKVRSWQFITAASIIIILIISYKLLKAFLSK